MMRTLRSGNFGESEVSLLRDRPEHVLTGLLSSHHRGSHLRCSSRCLSYHVSKQQNMVLEA